MASTPETALPPARGRRKLLLSALAGSAVVVAGVMFYLVRGAGVQAATTVQAVNPIFVTLEPLTVNLQTEGKPRFLHLGIALKVSDSRSETRIAEAMPELRSRLLLLLSNREPASLETPAEKTALAAEITAELNRPLAPGLPAHGINGVVFNAFVVQ